VRSPARPGQLRLWWLGQSGYLIQHDGLRLLVDPYLSDSLTVKYANTDKPHVRMTERVVDPARLDFIDVITSSHNHTDHLDAETLVPILRNNPLARLVIPEANRAFVAERLHIDATMPRGLDAGKHLDLGPVTIHAVPAAHNELSKDDAGRHLFLGYVFQIGRWTVYHAGDTLLFPGLADTLRKFRIDIALLPINGNVPERRVAGNLSGSEAAQLAKDIGARVVIPCHYEMFEFNTVTPDAFVDACTRLNQPYKVLCAGERFTSDELPEQLK
jgi:L-ascorbate metabolism protein UlaG (beta-lactamase superfamily)